MEGQQKKSGKKKILPIILGIVIVSGAIYGTQKYIYSRTHEDTDDAQLEGNMSPVLPRIAGYIKNINFQDNQQIKMGDTLLLIDDHDLQIKVQQSQAAVDNAKAALEVSKANVPTSTSSVESARASVENAKVRLWKVSKDFDRYEKLLSEKSITQQQADNAKADKESAETQLKVAEKQLSSLQSQVHASEEQVKVAESVVKQRQADLDYAKLQLSYTIITAPMSGVISKKNVQPGQYIQPGQSLCTIVGDNEIWVVANFKETQLKNMKIGEEVDVEIDAYKNLALKGEVASFAGATGARFSLLPPDNATGNFVKVVQRMPVKIKLNTDKEQLTLLHPGLSAHVVVNTK